MFLQINSRKIIEITTLTVILFVLIGNASGKKIHIKGNTFVPEESKAPENRLGTNSLQTQSNKEEYMLLQFNNPVKKQYRENLSRKGMKFISYIPENAWITKITGEKAEIISEEKVRSLTPYKPSYKIDPNLKKELKNNPGKLKARVEFFSSEKSPKNILEKYGEVNSEFSSDTWKIEISYSDIAELSKEKHVKWISKEPPSFETKNNDSRALIGIDTLQENPYNLRGQGFTAGIWDGGSVKYHEDLNYTGKTILGEDNGVSNHAVHVAGTMLGGGRIDLGYGTPNRFRGVAYKASLVSYDFGYSDSKDLYNEVDESITEYDSILSQNSWGWKMSNADQSLLGDYTQDSTFFDKIVAGETNEVSEKISVIFAAGNEGDSYSPRYNTTTGPGATSKNTITAGAVNDTGGMTSYSSWGPTDDGRIKPTLVADGGQSGALIGSTYPASSGVYPYAGLKGTSMAAPAVSGTVILLNEQFNKTYDRLPEPATVKGSLIHTAEDLGRKGPDYKFGWGLVNATEAVNYVKDSERKDLIKRDNLTSLGDSKSYKVTVPKSENLEFTLVWSDYPADSGPAGKALVNDLDLIVKNSTGHRKYPYTLSWEKRTEPANQNSKDDTNVVEQVEIANSQDNFYNVTINASNSINSSYQDYSLLLSEKSSLKPDIDIESPENSSYKIKPSFNLSSLNNMEDAKFSLDENGNYSMTKKNSTYFYNNSVELSEGRHDVVFWANNSASYWSSKSVQFTLDTQNPSLNVKEPSKGANISGNFTVNATWSDETTGVEKHNYTIYNSTYSETGILNDTLNSSQFADGEYNISFNVTDSAGNFNNSTIEVTIDNTEPVLNSFSPSDNQNFSSNFTINATWSDATSNVNSSEYEFWNSSFSSQGDLNSSIDISELRNGDYNISYLIEDYAGNKINKTIEITVDEENPSLQVFNPSNSSFVTSNFTVNATFADEFTGIKQANYTIYNDSKQLEGDLNDTLNTSKLAEGEYNISYNVSDFAGNKNTSRININLDKTQPELNITSPENKTHLAGNFSVNATFSDDLSEIETANYTLENESIQTTGKINSTINSTQFREGHYNLTAKVNDSAGNTATERHEIFIDNTAPLIDNSSIVDEGNVSGLQDIDISFNESSEINVSIFRWSNSSGNQTAWKDLNYTGFNTSNLSEGEYNITVKANDSLGNFRETNLTGITVDNTDPNISLTEYNLTSTHRGWINNSKTVQTDCVDSLTGPEKVSVNEEINRTIPGNLTITKMGNNTHSFTCHDFAGNNDSETIRFAIDSQNPNITGFSPSNNSKNLNRKFTIKVEFNNESKESGLNLSASSVNTNRGKTSLTWSNSSVKIQVSNLDYSKTVKTTGKLEDNLGHRESFYIEHSTKSEPEDDSGSSSSGGGGGGGNFATAPVTDENNSEDGSTEEDLNKDRNSSDGEQTFKLNPGRNNITITDEKSSVELIQTNTDKSTSVTVSESREEYEPPENTEKIDEFDISVNDSENTEMNITFRVNKSRIKEDRLDDTKLYRRNNTTWQELETDYLKSTNSSHVFKSKIPGFSPFMVAVKNSTISDRNETNITENTTRNKSIKEEQKQSSQAESIQSLLLISVLMLLILAPMILFTVKEYRDREE